MNQGNDSITSFRNIADAISAKYQAQVQLMTAELGTRPSFDDLMTLLKQMEKDLTGSGVKFLEKHKGDGKNTTQPDELRGIIRTTIEGFIKQL
ncbi:MAG: hypothetical protein H3C54_08710 [Taibaiella sp.]|nr:hypothetical protein [Taibaiella sp.]